MTVTGDFVKHEWSMQTWVSRYEPYLSLSVNW